MKRRHIKLILLGVVCLLGIVFFLKRNSHTEVETINIISTTDVHGNFSEELIDEFDKRKMEDEKLTIIDSGDFFDFEGLENPMFQWATGQKLIEVVNGKPVIEKISEPRIGVAPLVQDMIKAQYDIVTLGNHEFVANDYEKLKELVKTMKDGRIEVIASNTYNVDGTNFLKPYVIKEYEVQGKEPIRIGYLGLCYKEVGEKVEYNEETMELVESKSRLLEDQRGYKNKLFMKDILDDCSYWTEELKKEDVDAIILLAHSGERPKKPRNPGNHIQELASEFRDIDVILAGHTHKEIEEKIYNNLDNKKVLVAQAGKHGEKYIDLKLEFVNKNGNWILKDKKSKLVKLIDNNS